MAHILYENVSVTRLEHSEVEIRGDIPLEVVEKHRKAAVKEVSEHIEVPGFRKGHASEEVLVREVGEMAILEEMAERALAEAYPAIVLDQGLEVIGRPHITITKLARGNPLSFTAKTAVMPEFALPDYKAIAKKERESFTGTGGVVTDAEVEEAILNIRRRVAHYEKHHAGGEEHEHDAHDGSDLTDAELPPLDDAYVAKLGSFTSVSEFTAKIKENITADKAFKDKEARRMAIAEALIKATTIPLPPILRDAELDKMMGEFKSEIERMGIAVDDYFKGLSKTPDDIREEWKPEAEKRAKLQLILNRISEAETITLPEEKVGRDVAHVLEHYKDANPDSVRLYVETLMRNERVFEMLEGNEAA